MSSRVHKVSDKYAGHREELDRLRTIGANSRRTQKMARRVATMDKTVKAVELHLDTMNRRQLLQAAKNMDIKGRHTMTKDKLLVAIKAEMRKGD